MSQAVAGRVPHLKALPVADRQDNGKLKQHPVVIYGQEVLYAA